MAAAAAGAHDLEEVPELAAASAADGTFLVELYADHATQFGPGVVKALLAVLAEDPAS